MTRPMFITLEGSEGVGKTSNMEFIKSMLDEQNIRKYFLSCIDINPTTY